MDCEYNITPVLQEFPPANTVSGQKRKIITPSYFLASFLGPESFEAYVKLNPPTNPENKELTKDIEQALFYSYPDDMMFMNEAVFMILISHGFKFDNNLFALLVLGSIYDFVGVRGISQNSQLNACFTFYQNLEIKIKGDLNLMVQSQSFIRYMYYIESYNQQPYQDALERIPATISSFSTSSGKILFPKFSYDIF